MLSVAVGGRAFSWGVVLPKARASAVYSIEAAPPTESEGWVGLRGLARPRDLPRARTEPSDVKLGGTRSVSLPSLAVVSTANCRIRAKAYAQSCGSGDLASPVIVVSSVSVRVDKGLRRFGTAERAACLIPLIAA